MPSGIVERKRGASLQQPRADIFVGASSAFACPRTKFWKWYFRMVYHRLKILPSRCYAFLTEVGNILGSSTDTHCFFRRALNIIRHDSASFQILWSVGTAELWVSHAVEVEPCHTLFKTAIALKPKPLNLKP